MIAQVIGCLLLVATTGSRSTMPELEEIAIFSTQPYFCFPYIHSRQGGRARLSSREPRKGQGLLDYELHHLIQSSVALSSKYREDNKIMKGTLVSYDLGVKLSLLLQVLRSCIPSFHFSRTNNLCINIK